MLVYVNDGYFTVQAIFFIVSTFFLDFLGFWTFILISLLSIKFHIFHLKIFFFGFYGTEMYVEAVCDLHQCICPSIQRHVVTVHFMGKDYS